MKKIKLFLLPIMALAIVAFAVIGIAGLNDKPAQVSADGGNYIYFIKPDDWGSVKIHCWGGTNGTSWPGADMTWVSGNVYKYDVGTCTSMLFQISADNNKSADTSITVGNCYYCAGDYTNNGWTVSSVAYDPTTVYFYNTGDWENVYAYTYFSNKAHRLAGWPGVKISAEAGDGQLFAATALAGEGIIFNNGSGAQTGDLYYSSGKPYFYSGTTSGYRSKAQIDMKIANTWYLIGKIKGVENWNDSTLIKDADGSGSNHAIWYGVELDEGDEIKAVHGNDMPDYTAKGRKWDDSSVFSSCDEDGGNLKVNYDGIYDVYLYEDAYGNYYISIAPAFDVKNVLHKTSADNNYLLLVSAVNVTNVNYFAANNALWFKVGFNISKDSGAGDESASLTNVVYENVVIRKKGGGTVSYGADDMFGVSATDYLLIAYEYNDGTDLTGSEFSITPFIKVYDDKDYTNCIMTLYATNVSGTVSAVED